MNKILLMVLLSAPSLAMASTLYRCVDEHDHFTYTNYKFGDRKCTVMSTDSSRSSANAAAKPARKLETARVSPADFPKVSSETQKNRDSDRRYILEQELRSEQKSLDDARKSLAAQLVSAAATPPEKLQPLRDRMALHERNVTALQREISNLK